DADPILTDADVWSLNVLPSFQPQGPLTVLQSQVQSDQNQLTQLAAQQLPDANTESNLLRRFYTDYTREKALEFDTLADHFISNLAKLAVAAAYFDLPRVTSASAQTQVEQGTTTVATDILREEPQVVVTPGQNANAAATFRLSEGYTNS